MLTHAFTEDRSLITSIRAGGAAAGLLSLVALAGCGGGASNGTSSSTTGSTAVDPCLVNTWVSQSASGTFQGQQAQISGGTGEKVTVKGDGSIDIDDSGEAPMNITVGGQSVQVKSTGQATGRATTAGNKLAVTLDSGSTLMNQTLDTSGNPQGTPQPAPSTVSDTYTCSANQQLSLSMTESSGTQHTVVYVPASSNGGGAASSGTDTGSSSSSTSSSDTGGGSSSSDTGSSSST